MKEISLAELSNVLLLSENALKTWLDGYRFTKYKTKKGYLYQQEFINNLIEFLETKRKHECIKNLKNFIKNNHFNTCTKDLKTKNEQHTFIHQNSFKNYKYKWTSAAIDCFKIGCNCKKCSISEIMQTRCKMKEIVLELVKKYGAPKTEDENV